MTPAGASAAPVVATTGAAVPSAPLVVLLPGRGHDRPRDPVGAPALDALAQWLPALTPTE